MTFCPSRSFPFCLLHRSSSHRNDFSVHDRPYKYQSKVVCYSFSSTVKDAQHIACVQYRSPTHYFDHPTLLWIKQDRHTAQINWSLSCWITTNITHKYKTHLNYLSIVLIFTKKICKASKIENSLYTSCLASKWILNIRKTNLTSTKKSPKTCDNQ